MFKFNREKNRSEKTSQLQRRDGALTNVASDSRRHCNTPKISVVIPLYNKAQHIAATLGSVIGQSLAVYEIIVVDDGSTDSGPEEVKRFENVRLVSQANAGVSAARNRGIAEAHGDFVAFIDADDQWLPHFLEEVAFLIGRFPEAGVYATAYQFCNGRGEYKTPDVYFDKPVDEPRILDDYFFAGSRGDLPFMMSSLVVRRPAFKDIGLFPEGEAMGEDQDLFCRAALRSIIAYSPRVLSIYHLGSDNRACVNHIPERECPFSQRLRQYALATENPYLRATMWDYCAAHILHLASLNLRAGRLAAAKQLLDDKLSERNMMRRYWWLSRYWLASLSARAAHGSFST